MKMVAVPTQGQSFADEIKVSVIVRTYNRAHILSRCIDSLLRQTLPELEIIIVDDGSQDNTAEIVELYQRSDNRIKYVQHAVNKGGLAAYVTGIKASHGLFVGSVDSDDYVAENMYSHLYLEACNSSADVVSCGLQSYWLGSVTPVSHAQAGNYVDNYQRGLALMIITDSLCYKLHKRELLEQTLVEADDVICEAIKNKLHYNEDGFLSMLLAKYVRKYVVVDVPYYHYDCSVQREYSGDIWIARAEDYCLGMSLLCEHFAKNNDADSISNVMERFTNTFVAYQIKTIYLLNNEDKLKTMNYLKDMVERIDKDVAEKILLSIIELQICSINDLSVITNLSLLDKCKRLIVAVSRSILKLTGLQKVLQMKDFNHGE